MKFKMIHNNYNVRDLEKSLTFYKEALGLEEVRRIAPEDGSFIIVYLSDGDTPHHLELTWLKEWDRPYNLGDNEFHLDFEWMITKQPIKNILRWAVFVMKIRKWASILSMIQMDIGWKWFQLVPKN